MKPAYPRHARGRHRAGRERRPPLPDRSRLEARHRARRGAPASAPDDEQRADGHGRLRRPPEDSADYRRGYLCGMVRGDGHLRGRRVRARGRHDRTHAPFRLALVDLEALRRTETLPGRDRRRHRAPSRSARPPAPAGRCHAIRRRPGRKSSASTSCIRWPRSPSDDWRKGFLAGIFDAEGSLRRGVVRISNTDRAIIDWIAACLERFGFDARRGGHAARRTACGTSACAAASASICASSTWSTPRSRASGRSRARRSRPTRARGDDVEPLGVAMRLYDITTGTGDFIANGVVSHNCFARPTHTYLDFDAGRDFEREIVVKVNAPEVLRVELARPSWKGEHVALGTNTDPYQWVEGRYRLMRGIWEALRDAANPCSVLTKSPLLLRDIELMKRDRRGGRVHGEPVGPDARREGVAGDRAAHAEPARAARGGRRAQPRRDPDGRPRRAADARHQRRPEQVARSSSWRPRPGRPRSAASRCTCAARCAGSSSTGCAPSAPTSWRATSELYRRGAYVPRAEADRVQGLLRRGRRQNVARGSSRPWRARRARRASTPSRDRRPPRSAKRCCSDEGCAGLAQGGGV